MSHLIYQSNMLGTARETSAAFVDNATRPAGATDDPRLPLGLSLIFLLTMSAILWAGIIVLASCTSHYLLHLT
jgi:hypothetical protein